MSQSFDHVFHSRLERDFSALYDTELLDSPSEPVFDRLTDIAVRLLDVPIALISLVDTDRQFFKSDCGLAEMGLNLTETPLSHSFCQHVVVLEQPLVVNDARQHPLVHNNLAVRDMGVLAYLGVPISDGHGTIIGSLCALDSKPREWSNDDIDVLNSLANQFESELKLRYEARVYREELKKLKHRTTERERTTRYIIHDLRTPLTSLLLSLDLMPLLGSLNAKQLDNLKYARRDIETLQKMVDNLMGADDQASVVTGDMPLKLSEFHFRDLILSAVEQVALLAAGKGIELETADAETLPPILVDGEKLIRVLVNLIGNAVKFTPTGGRVSVSVRQDNLDGIDRLVLAVADTGIGISQGDADRIFEEGVRLSGENISHTRTTGLGLAFCKRIVEAHGGHIILESEPQVGSTFHLHFPLAAAIGARLGAGPQL